MLMRNSSQQPMLKKHKKDGKAHTPTFPRATVAYSLLLKITKSCTHRCTGCVILVILVSNFINISKYFFDKFSDLQDWFPKDNAVKVINVR